MAVSQPASGMELIDLRQMNRFQICGHWRRLPVLALGLLFALQSCTHPVRRMIFQPHRIEHLPAFPRHQPGLKRIWLETEAGRIEGWLFQGHGVSRRHPGPAVMIAHGNRELIDHDLARAQGYQALGFTVLLGEYRGYGRSEGRPSREGIRADAIRFYDMLAAQPTVDPGRIVFHGRSLGGAVLADLVPYRRPAAVVLESTFTSIKAMAYGAPNFLLSDRYDTPSAMSSFDGPVLIVHGERDKVVPVAHAWQLKKAIPQAELLIGDFGHSDLLSDEDRFWRFLRQFFQKHYLVTTGRPHPPAPVREP